MTDTEDILIGIQRCKSFSSLLPSQLKLLATQSQALTFARGECVFEPGDQADCLFVLVEGRAVISHQEDGKRAVIESVWPDEMFGQCALIHSGPREAKCGTPKSAAVSRNPLQPIRALMETNSRFARDLIEDVGAAMRKMAFRLVSVLIRPKRQRLLDVLHQLARSRGTKTEDGILIPAGFTHQELGDTIGATRETVTLMLGELKRENFVDLIGRQIIIRRT